MSPTALLSGLLGAVIAAWLVSRVQRSAPQIEPDRIVLRLHPGFAWGGLIVAALFLFIAAYNARHGSLVNSWWVAFSVPLVMGLMGLYVAVEGFFTRVTLTEDGVTVTTVWGTKHAPWNDIVHVSEHPFSGHVVLRTRSGTILRVSNMVSGLYALGQALEDHDIHG